MTDHTNETHYEIRCNKSKESLKLARKEGVTKMDLKKLALSKGWAWVDKDTHYSPKHAPAKPVKAKKVAKAVKKAATKPAAKKASKPSKPAKKGPMVFGTLGANKPAPAPVEPSSNEE